VRIPFAEQVEYIGVIRHSAMKGVTLAVKTSEAILLRGKQTQRHLGLNLVFNSSKKHVVPGSSGEFRPAFQRERLEKSTPKYGKKKVKSKKLSLIFTGGVFETESHFRATAPNFLPWIRHILRSEPIPCNVCFQISNRCAQSRILLLLPTFIQNRRQKVVSRGALHLCGGLCVRTGGLDIQI